MREGGRDKEADCMWLKQRVENLRYLLRRELPGSYLPVLRRGGGKKVSGRKTVARRKMWRRKKKVQGEWKDRGTDGDRKT